MSPKKIIYTILSLSLLIINISCPVQAQEDVAEYGIVIIPDNQCLKKAQVLNKEIAKNLPTLENLPNKWHVTLFQGAFTRADIKKIKSALSQLDVKQFDIEFEDVKDTRDRWIDWTIDDTSELQKLHEKIVLIASPLYRRPINRSSTAYDFLDEEEQKQIDEYGVNGVMELYKPHMSLFYVCPPNPIIKKVPPLIEDEKYEDVSCKAKKIVIGKLGYDGNMTKIVHTILLK